MAAREVTVLLVDDNDVDREAVKRAFAKHRIANTIVTAHNGAIKVADSPMASGARFVIALPAL